LLSAPLVAASGPFQYSLCVVDQYLALERCDYLGGYVPTSGPTPARLSFSPVGVVAESMGEYWTPWVSIDWDQVRDLQVDGPDAAQMRPSVAAVVAFGVLGLAARRREWSAIVDISTAEGELVFEVIGEAAPALRAKLEPFLRELVHPSEAAATPDGPPELLAKLADLHAAGVLTDDEFSEKKKTLLGRI
jgi:hypothetical protein